MPVVSADVYRILFAVSRYLLPLIGVLMVFFALFWLLSESRNRREMIRNLPGSGTVGELVVLSGSRELAPGTWFPVPREGIIGSVRSCDLVIPCPGVRNQHLDFSWQDGRGLLVFPRTGCEVMVGDRTVTCRTDASSVPLTHGSVLQIGSAVLRLHLFSALDSTSPSVPFGSLPVQEPFPPCQEPLALQNTPVCPDVTAVPPVPGIPECSNEPVPLVSEPAHSADPPQVSGRWKEDMGE